MLIKSKQNLAFFVYFAKKAKILCKVGDEMQGVMLDLTLSQALNNQDYGENCREKSSGLFLNVRKINFYAIRQVLSLLLLPICTQSAAMWIKAGYNLR